jgi:rhodanese-related sulfurtransferase
VNYDRETESECAKASEARITIPASIRNVDVRRLDSHPARSDPMPPPRTTRDREIITYCQSGQRPASPREFFYSMAIAYEI